MSHQRKAGRPGNRKHAQTETGARLHSSKQAKKRYGIGLPARVRKRIRDEVVAGEAEVVKLQNNGRNVYRTRVYGKPLIFVWAEVDELIITVLPPDWKPREVEE